MSPIRIAIEVLLFLLRAALGGFLAVLTFRVGTTLWYALRYRRGALQGPPVATLDELCARVQTIDPDAGASYRRMALLPLASTVRVVPRGWLRRIGYVGPAWVLRFPPTSTRRLFWAHWRWRILRLVRYRITYWKETAYFPTDIGEPLRFRVRVPYGGTLPGLVLVAGPLGTDGRTPPSLPLPGPSKSAAR
jgi:hypothetical protein